MNVFSMGFAMLVKLYKCQEISLSNCLPALLSPFLPVQAVTCRMTPVP